MYNPFDSDCECQAKFWLLPMEDMRAREGNDENLEDHPLELREVRLWTPGVDGAGG